MDSIQGAESKALLRPQPKGQDATETPHGVGLIRRMVRLHSCLSGGGYRIDWPRTGAATTERSARTRALATPRRSSWRNALAFLCATLRPLAYLASLWRPASLELPFPSRQHHVK